MKSRANESRSEPAQLMPSAAGIGQNVRDPLSPPAHKAKSSALPLRSAKKRRANLLYKLRRKGIEADTKRRVIFIPYGQQPQQFIQAIRLCREFHFNIQFIIT